KVAVASRQDGLDPVGATVGQRGARVQSVVAELGGEKIDVIPWNDDPAVFVANALSPAQVLGVTIDEEHRIASVTVPERMLSLAIGREGQNARLAAKLTGWRIDIRSDVSVAEAKAAAEARAVTDVAAIEPAPAAAPLTESAVEAAPAAKKAPARKTAAKAEAAGAASPGEIAAATKKAPARKTVAKAAAGSASAPEAAPAAEPAATKRKRTTKAIATEEVSS
ncbi:MAG TPA: hypothetical protein VK656_03380, partial [Candidatus Acidoferrum sp.]|nr:hypothetical protein [Candidatus Acidoferrum sp.]